MIAETARRDGGQGPAEEGPWLVFSDDWGRHPSSCQHLIRHLLPRHSVLWVNTVGTRRPSLGGYGLRRGVEKVSGWLLRRERRRSEAGPVVLNPVMWPSFRSAAGRGLNRWLLERAVRRALGGRRAPVAITTLPIVADLVGRLAVDRWVYYCVDDLSKWPGLDGQALEEMESELVQRVDGIVAVSHRLAARLAQLGRSSGVLSHGVDLEHWVARAGPPVELAGLERPLVVFWGVVDRRLEVAWLEALAHRLDRGTLLLAGPSNDPDPALARLPRLARSGPIPYDRLPEVGREAGVLIMPYADLPVTRAIQPLKLKEYLATGRPTVVRSLPATEPWADCCDVVATAEAFADGVLERLATGLPPAQREARRRRLVQESWTHKAQLFETMVLGTS